jgi:hypothetical protein
MAQTPRTPDVEAQRAAMKKLDFLIGEWSGEASALRGPGQFAELTQTESAQFKLDGLVLVIEGVGRTKTDGKLALQALGLISFNDETGTYQMRAFNDGQWLETEVKLAYGGNSISWGFALGDFKTTTVLRINENGEWTEHLSVGSTTSRGAPPRHSAADGLENRNRSVANLISLPRVSIGLPTFCRKPETPALTDCLDSAHSFLIHWGYKFRFQLAKPSVQGVHGHSSSYLYGGISTSSIHIRNASSVILPGGFSPFASFSIHSVQYARHLAECGTQASFVG